MTARVSPCTSPEAPCRELRRRLRGGESATEMTVPIMRSQHHGTLSTDGDSLPLRIPAPDWTLACPGSE